MSSDPPKVTHIPSASGGEFVIGREAILTYRNAGEGHIIVNHTRVARKMKVRASQATSIAPWLTLPGKKICR